MASRYYITHLQLELLREFTRLKENDKVTSLLSEIREKQWISFISEVI